jgi:hypothetical protein
MQMIRSADSGLNRAWREAGRKGAKATANKR